MSELRPEINASQRQRFVALWNMLSPDGRPKTDIITVNNGNRVEHAVIKTLLEDINPPITDERIVQVNRAPDRRVIELAMGEIFVRCSELGIILNGNDQYIAGQLDTLEGVVFSEDHIGINNIPGMRP